MPDWFKELGFSEEEKEELQRRMRADRDEGKIESIGGAKRNLRPEQRSFSVKSNRQKESGRPYLQRDST
jgi:hypothetical protein